MHNVYINNEYSNAVIYWTRWTDKGLKLHRSKTFEPEHTYWIIVNLGNHKIYGHNGKKWHKIWILQGPDARIAMMPGGPTRSKRIIDLCDQAMRLLVQSE